MELGCFLAGALLSSQGHMVTTEVMGCIEPIRDFLAIIFFASIGEMLPGSGRLLGCYTCFIRVPGRCRLPRVPNLRAVRAHHPSGSDVHARHYEGTVRSSASLPPHSPFTATPCSCSHPVLDGRAGSVRDLASGLSTHTVGRVRWARAGQRILLRPGQPRSSGRDHLQRSE